MAEVDRPVPGVLAIATAPARFVSRFRPDLAASIQADALTFAGPRTALFAVLALLAVAYPLVVSLVRAVMDLGPEPNSDLEMAMRPIFPYGYTESLPFMILALGIGTFSPALGALYVLVHAPADLLSTAMTHAPGAQFIPAGAAIAARLISDAVLWIGAVELPLLARRWAATWPAALVDQPSTIRSATVMTAAMAVLTYLWVNTAFWLVMPVFNWTVQGGPGAVMPLGMVLATLVFGWIVVAAVAAITFVAGLAMPAEALAAGIRYGRAAPPGLGRELMNVVVLGLLLSGLMLRPSEASSPSNEAILVLLVVGGLVVAGPGLTRLLPRIPFPRGVAAAPPVLRWAAALTLAFGGTWLVVSVVPVGAIPDYILLAILFAIIAPVVRIIVDAGTPAGPSPVDASLSAPLGTIVRLMLIVAVWMAAPAVVLGHDESPGMPQGYPAGAGALLGGAALGAAAASRKSGGNDPSNPRPIPRPGPQLPPKPPPKAPPRPDGPLGPPKKEPPKEPDNFKWWNPTTWF